MECVYFAIEPADRTFAPLHTLDTYASAEGLAPGNTNKQSRDLLNFTNMLISDQELTSSTCLWDFS